MNRRTDSMLHVAAQYLAAAGRNYVPVQDDDSHTNLGWDNRTQSFASRTFARGEELRLHTVGFQLEWTGSAPKRLALTGRDHQDVVGWLVQCARSNGHSGYVFDMPYALAIGPITHDFTLEALDPKRIAQLAGYRSMAQKACQATLVTLGHEAEVRVWPHHFDTGAFVQLSDSSGVSIGLGMAVPDAMVDEYYLYTSGYRGPDAIIPEKLPNLTNGQWRDGDWKGALLPVPELDPADMDRFFLESFRAFTQ